MADTAGDIRSVIKNATQGGLVNKGGLDLKKGAGATGKGNTIATKDEIATQKTDNALNPKPTTTTQTATPTTNKSPISMVADSVNANTVKNTTPQVSTNKGAIIPSTQQNVGIFENSTVQPIENIKVFSGHDINLKKAKKQEPKKNLLIETEGERSKRMGDGVYNLYTDAYKRAQNGGTVTIDEILSNKDYQKEFNGIDQSVLQQLVDDANLLAESEYDAGNVLQLMQKYNNLGLKLDAEKLPSKTKAQLFDEMASGEGGLWELVDWGTSLPFHLAELGISNAIGDENAGKVKKHINDFRGWMQDQKVDVLSKDELANYTKDSIAKLDKEYEKYYHNETEEIFTDRKVGQQFYKDVAKLQKEKGISEKEAVDEVMKNGKYNGVAYEKFSHETTDQGRFWDDKDKEKEYNKRVKDLEDSIRSQHGEDYAAAKNLVLGMAELPFVGYDIVTNLGSFAKNLWSGAKGAGHKAIEGYADLIDTAIATGEDIISGDYNGINYQVGDIREKMAKGKGYENWDDMLNRLGQIAETGDEPGVKLVYSMLQDMSQDKDTAAMMGQYFVDMYGGAVEGDWDKVKESIIENPRDFVSDVATLGELSTGLLKKFGMISPERANEVMKFWGGIDPYEGTINLMNDIQYGPVLQTEKALAKSTAWAFRQPFKMLGNTLEFMMNKLTGISDEERKFIKENPDAVASYVKGEETSQGLLDKIKEKFNQLKDEKKRAGEVYDDLKKGVNRITTDGIFDGVNEKLAEKGIYLVNGKLQFPEIGFTEKQQKQIVQAYDMLKKLQKGEVSASDAWGVRRMIDSTLDWEGNTKQGLDAEAINLIKDIRRGIDEALKEQVPGFREADANFAQVSNEIKSLEKDWFNKDGTLKDNAYSKIRNLLNKGANEPKLERLERYLPGITKELRALSVSESLEKAGKAMVGQYANQIWGVGGGLTAIMGMLTGGAAVVPMVLGMLGATLATPKNLAALLRWQGAIEKPFKSVISKIENGIKLTAQETQLLAQFLSANREKLSEDAKYMYEKGLITDEEFKAIQEKKAGLKQAMRKIEKDYKAGKISTKEYKEAKAVYREALNNAEYDTALIKARDKAGDEEKILSRGEAKNVGGKYGAKAENVGFVANIEKDMTAESRKAGTEVRGYADLKNKLYNLSKNPTDTTAQHEFFHAVFSVVDPQTRKYLLNEARKILGGKVGDMAAEEWLAESFGIYAKRGDINAGVLNKVKWGEGVLVNKLRNFFQKNYEWLQNYNGDRKTINKMFNEILKDKWMLDEEGKLDLSYLLNDKKPGGLKGKLGLESKANKKALSLSSKEGYRPSDLLEGGVKQKNAPRKPFNGGNGIRFKKDTGATKYKADINGKSVDIDTKATSPDQLAKVNSEGLSVMKSFISEKQAEKALSVNKNLLTKDGDAYLWTHTNKYEAPQFANFENTKDSKYKEFKDYEIAFFSNSEEMSKSYAKGKSTLADTKGYKDVEDFNKKNLTVEKNKSEQTTRSGKKIPTEVEVTKGTRLVEGKSGKSYMENVVENKRTLDTNLDKLLDDMEIAKEGYEWKPGLDDNNTKHTLTRNERITRLKYILGGDYSWGRWDVDVKELPNGKVEILRSKNNILKEEYASAKEAMAKFTAAKTESKPYHYQGIIQDVKKPLVVDLGKKDYGLKDWKTGEKLDTGRGWNDLGTAYDLLEREDKKGLKTLEKVNEKFNKTFGKLSDQRRKFILRTSDLRWQYSKRYDEFWQKIGGMMDDKNRAKVKELDSDMAQALNASLKINQYLNGEIKYVDGEILEWIKKHDDYNKVYNEVSDFVKENNNSLEYISYGDGKKKDIKDWLVKNGLDEDVVSLLHDIRLSGESDIIELLKGKDLQTNDYVFYALKNGNYDGVIFKDILDFGSNDAFDKATNKGGDVLVTFKSKNFKAWDNANPTDSKYISYKKDTKGLARKDMGLKAKDQTQTPEFKKWFKGSKVVNEDGTPKVVYHGSRHAGFTQFKPVNTMTDDLWFFSDKRKISSYFGGGSELWSDKGLTAEFNDAKKKGVDAVQKFAKEYLDLPHEIEVTVNHITPKEAKEFGVEPGYVYMLDDGQITGAIKMDGKHILKEKLSQEEIDKAIIDRIEGNVEFAEAGDRKNSRVYASYLDLKNPIIVDAKGVKFNQVVNPFNGKRGHIANIAYDAVDKGYDGAIIKNVSESPEYDLRGTVYIATKPNQIKSATDNIGTFDKNNPDIRYKKARHGSPADFDRFDSSHMGEGEGAQAHGWGHYVAVNKETGLQYGKMGARKYQGKQIGGFGNLYDELYNSKEYSTDVVNAVKEISILADRENISIKEAKQKALERRKEWLKDAEERLEKAKKRGIESNIQDVEYLVKRSKILIDTIKDINEKDFNTRNLYELEIPDPVKRDTPTGTNYIEEDGKLTLEQRKDLIKRLREKNKDDNHYQLGVNYLENMLYGAQFKGDDTRKDVYRYFSDGLLERPKEASKALEAIGYDGIHYFGGRDGEAYVLFNDNAPQIQNHIRYKKDTNGLAKKSNGLQKKPSLTKPIRNLDATMKDGKYFDNLGKEIPKGAYYNINRYNKLLQKYQNAVKYKNYLAQYDLIEELNGLAHRIKKQTKNKSYEKNTYPMKNGFARKEMKRRGKDIIKWDAEEEMYYIVRPDGKKGVHVADSVGKGIPKI